MPWTAGKTTYHEVQRGGERFAVPEGKTLADRPFVYRVSIETRSGKEYFTNTETHQKRWTLPQLARSSARPVRDRIVAIYEMSDPDQLANVDLHLSNYEGREAELVQSLVDQYGPEPPYYPASSPAASTKLRLTAFYEKYNPTKLASVDDILAQFRGKEASMFRRLVKQYGPEPENTEEAQPVVAPSASLEETCERVLALFRRHRPTKLDSVPGLLEKWKGQEDALLVKMVEKFGPEPEPGVEPPPGAAAAGVNLNASFATLPNTSIADASQLSPALSLAGTDASPLSHRQRLVRFYEKYNPAKLGSVDNQLAKNHGNEEALLAALVAKYGPEPAPTPQAATTPNAVAAGAAAAAGGGGGRSKQPSPHENQQASPTPTGEGTTAATRAQSPPSASGVAPPPGSASASSASTEELKARVRAVYAHYKPEKPHLAESALLRYEGQEAVLLETLVSRYGPEPVPRAPPPPAAVPPAEDAAAASSRSEAGPNEALTSTQPGKEGDDYGQAVDSNSSSPSAGCKENREQQEEEEGAVVDLAGEVDNDEPATTDESPRAGAETHVSSRSSASAHPAADESQHAAASLPSTSTQGAAPTTHSVFSDYASSPPQERQQLLMGFLSDREQRLKEALDRGADADRAVAALRAQNASLVEQLDTITAETKATVRQQQAEAAAIQERAQESIRLWNLERQQLQAQHRADDVAAQRALAELRLQVEEERERRAKEAAALQRRVSEADDDVKDVTSRATDLLASLERRQAECRQLNATILELEQRLIPPETADAEAQTDIALDPFAIDSLPPQGVVDLDATARTTAAAHSTAHNAGGAAAGSGPNGPRRRCGRCGRTARVACRQCRLLLCLKCDEAVHTSNARYRQHERTLLETHRAGGQQGANPGSASASWIQSNHHCAGAAMDVEAAFDEALADHERQQHDASAEYRQTVLALEEQVQQLQAECAALEAGRLSAAASFSQHRGGAGNQVDEAAARRRAAALEAQARKDKQTVRSLSTANAELTRRIEELELELAAQPSLADAAVSPAGGALPSDNNRAPVEEMRLREGEVRVLSEELAEAKGLVRDYKRQIQALRGQLHVQMAAPLGGRR